MNEQQTLLHKVQMLTFAVTDMALYLDTHPNCRNGLAWFKKQKRALNEAKAEYEARFGPLTAEPVGDDSRWNWIDGPWPWEGKV